MVLRILAAMLAVVFAAAALGLGFAMAEVNDLARCADREAFLASGEDECIEGSPSQRAGGLILGYAATALAALAAGFGVAYAARRRYGGALATSAFFAVACAAGALALLPVSF